MSWTVQRLHFPFRLAYSTTFNDSQELTLDKTVLDLHCKVFAHGQLYTALSWVRVREDSCILLQDEKYDNCTTNVVYKDLHLKYDSNHKDLVNFIACTRQSCLPCIKYWALVSAWRWNIGTWGNTLHCALKINIIYWALDSAWKWNVGKLGNELHGPLKSNIEHLALDLAWGWMNGKSGNELHCTLKRNIKYQAPDWAWRWNIGKLVNELHFPLKTNIKYRTPDFARKWNIGKLGNELHHPLKTKTKYQAVDLV